MKRRLFPVKWILSVSLLMTVWPTTVNGFIQSPSDANISEAIKRYFRKTPPWEIIRGMFLPRNPQVQTVRVERRGPYNSQKGYWPIKAYVTGTVRAAEMVGAKDRSAPCTFEGTTDFHIFKDDYGDWSARVAVLYLAEQQLRPNCDFSAAETGRPAERPRTEEKRPAEPAPSGRVDYPSSRFRTYTELNLFTVTVPENWLKLPAKSSVTFAPEGGHGVHQGNFFFSHGVQIGASRVNERTLRQATDDLVNLLSQGNRSLRRRSEFRPERIASKDALSIVLTNISEGTGQTEYVTLYTTLLSAGNLLYVICVAPEGDYPSYQTVFQKIVRSIEVTSSSSTSSVESVAGSYTFVSSSIPRLNSSLTLKDNGSFRMTIHLGDDEEMLGSYKVTGDTISFYNIHGTSSSRIEMAGKFEGRRIKITGKEKGDTFEIVYEKR